MFLGPTPWVQGCLVVLPSDMPALARDSEYAVLPTSTSRLSSIAGRCIYSPVLLNSASLLLFSLRYSLMALCEGMPSAEIPIGILSPLTLDLHCNLA